ncbi:HesA/MoeB/ThiF family protein [Endothiovibrio diazotrophicus]
MNDDQLLRYSRQIMLPRVGVEGQQRLLESTALIVGLGGLGSPAALYLAAAGVGELIVVDFDTVELSNLQRQVLHTTADLGRRKVDSARDALAAINPEVGVEIVSRRLEGEALREVVARADVVLDGSDNFATRFALNEACVATGTPLVSAAVIRMEGQLSVFDPRVGESPCYRCLYRDEGGEPEEGCVESGVLAPVAGVLGTLQATEALKVLMGVGRTLSGRLLMIDAETMEIRTLKLRRDPRCPVCSGS